MQLKIPPLRSSFGHSQGECTKPWSRRESELFYSRRLYHQEEFGNPLSYHQQPSVRYGLRVQYR